MSDMSTTLQIIEKNSMLLSQIGDCPNIELPTSGGKVFWQDKKNSNGWRLQYNYMTGLSRIIDENDIRKAWGNPAVMEEKFKRLTRTDFLEPGDVIGVARKNALNIYEHYAVYIGKEKVVHYSATGADVGDRVAVRIDTLQNFLKKDKEYFVLFFEKSGLVPHKIQAQTSFNMSDTDYNGSIGLKKTRNFKLYSPEETVTRALSRVGEDKYSLLLNNCEHFAIWCKTGVSESYQVDKAISSLLIMQLLKGGIL